MHPCCGMAQKRKNRRAEYLFLCIGSKRLLPRDADRARDKGLERCSSLNGSHGKERALLIRLIAWIDADTHRQPPPSRRHDKVRKKPRLSFWRIGMVMMPQMMPLQLHDMELQRRLLRVLIHCMAQQRRLLRVLIHCMAQQRRWQQRLT